MKFEWSKIARISIMNTLVLWMFIGFAQANTFQADTTKASASKQSLISAKNRNANRVAVIAEESDKLINNVKVYYNPIADQVTVNFKLSKNSHVSIKVMDALGNEVLALHNGDLDAGTQNLNFDSSAKLKEGIYFVRVMSGSETVVKRISVR
ncbi:T9SS type A sorting domain-containing protein [Sphingobacterium hotanense]|uniref:T9SS type A sorting domain-containing protein n=1 Tax=Sphingobacterium hotanense TaxID=649196 RepID=A0ABT7NNI9_9SPHI|nr:T9SS type A sorting domain-containing protein [Sphingobacterium hotanense]MDM1048804.1 T9SS type A sorting domain-containing protein [Sphingobacterium hotanense]